MAEDREQNVGQNVGDKEKAADSEKDVEGHGWGTPARAAEGDDKEEPDVEGHGFVPPQQTDGI